MQVICPISGIVLLKCDYLLGEDYSEIAPIFRRPRKSLVTPETLYKFTKAPSEIEKRLWFLAVINSTELVTFQTIAKPSLRICEKNFYHAIDIAGWMDFALYTVAKQVVFPRFIVREDNADLENVSSWLDAIEEIRQDFVKKDEDKEMKYRLSQQHEKWKKELVNAVVQDRMFTPRLVSWLFEQSGLEDHPKESLYRRILLTPVKECAGISIALVQEIVEVLSDNFGHNHPLASTIYGQLHQFKIAIKEGADTFQILDEEYSRIENGELVTSAMPIGEVYADKLMKTHGSLSEPREKDFPTRWKFLQAHALWELSQHKPSSLPTQTIISAKADPIEEEVKEHFAELDGLNHEIADLPDETDQDDETGED